MEVNFWFEAAFWLAVLWLYLWLNGINPGDLLQKLRRKK